jgi:hypothetical protein
VLAGTVKSDAVRFVPGSSLGCLPRRRPLAFATRIPSRVRIRMRSDSNSATIASTLNSKQHIAELSRDLHELAEFLDPDPEQLRSRHGHTGKERPLAHQHAQLTDEVALFDHEDDAVVPAVEEQDSAGEDEGLVVGVPGVPQRLAGLGAQHLAGGAAACPTRPR